MQKSPLPLTSADLAFAPLALAAITATWVPLAVGGLQLVDIFIALSAPLCLVHILATRRQIPRLPWWLMIGTLGIVLVIVAHTFFPTSDSYMARRSILSAKDMVFDTPEASALGGVQWILALLVLPALVAIAVQGKKQRASALLRFWMLGASISSLVAITDYVGVTSINLALTGLVNISGREGGLTLHPNNMGIAAALTIPVAIHYATRNRFLGSVCIVTLAAGAFLSGSRAAQIATLVAVVVSIAWSKRKGPIVRRLAATVIASAVVVQTLFSDMITKAFGLFRFDSVTADDSDAGRAVIFAQGLSDFFERPFFGVGLEVIAHAHSIYVQILAAGGLVLALTMACFLCGALARSTTLARTGEVLGPVFMGSLAAWLVAGIASNQLTDRYIYFGIAAMVALDAYGRAEADEPVLAIATTAVSTRRKLPRLPATALLGASRR
ncbi:O-antigen ligase family protein [Arthrobacter sp. 754]|uniref:O-antigen ligase family protein n=1 Tax=Arthrobacter sp. 754 TaxID=3156315 RepID=UPI00339B5CA0